MCLHKWVDSENQLKQDAGETRNHCPGSVAESSLTYARPWLLSLALGENLRCFYAMVRENLGNRLLQYRLGNIL